MDSGLRTQTGWRHYVWWALLAVLTTAGCPADQDGEQTAGEGDQGATAAAPPAAGDWIAPDRLQYYINDPIEISYRLEHDAPNSPAWIAMVPAGTASLLAGDNFAARVEFAHIYDLPEGSTRFHAKRNGEYVLRLFGARQNDAEAVAQSAVLRVGPPPGEQRQLTPPFVTLSGVELPEEIVLRPGQVIAAYWMLAELPPAEAWIGMVPVACTSTDAADNLAVAVARRPLNGKAMGPTRFLLEQPGDYVFRLFSSEEAGAEMICQSEEFTVREPAD